MIGYKLTVEQKNQLQGAFLTSSVFFNCTESTEGLWYLSISKDDKILIEDSNYDWILSLDKEEFTPIPPPSLPNSSNSL